MITRVMPEGPGDATAYRCRRCGGPSPTGVGGTDYRPHAAAARCSRIVRCPCGWSRRPADHRKGRI